MQSFLIFCTVICSLFGDKLKDYIYKPNIKLDIKKPSIVRDEAHNSSDDDIYIRVGLKNDGNSIAKDCRCTIDYVKQIKADGSVRSTLVTHHVNAIWCQNNGAISIFSNDVEYINLAKLSHPKSSNNNNTNLDLQLEILNEDKSIVFASPCKVMIELDIKYNNTYKKIYNIKITWHGKNKDDIENDFNIEAGE